MTTDRKAQLIVTCMFRHLTDDEKDELAALLLDESHSTDSGSPEPTSQSQSGIADGAQDHTNRSQA